MSINNLDLDNHPIFGKPKIVPANTIKRKNTNKQKMIWIGLGFSIIIGLALGLVAATGWFGQLWQSLLEGQLGSNIGAGLAGQSPWVMARVGGVMAYVTSFASVLLGLVMSLKIRWIRQFLPPPTTFHLHKVLALLSLVFLAIHLGGLLLDHYVKISLWQLLVPFSTDAYRPIWTGLGTLVLYGLALVIVTAYLAKKLGYKTWRTVHYLTFGIFALSLIHGIMAGTDTGSWWMLSIYVGSGLLVALLTALRFMPGRTSMQTKKVIRA